MNNLPCWTIQELITRYELEPDLTDVFVEGAFDRDVFCSIPTLTKAGYAFYEIDSVYIPPDLLIRHGLSSGNKQRVVVLARELAAIQQAIKVICLVDKDFDHWLGISESTAPLRFTIYCSIDCHFLTKDIARDILITAGHIKVDDFDILYESMANVLRILYALRLSARQCSEGFKWVTLKKYLRRNGDSILFDLDRYKTALLLVNGYKSQQNKFDSALSDWLKRLDCDIRQCSRGHDYQTLLAWVMNEFKGSKEFTTEHAIERFFVLLARTAFTLLKEVKYA